MYSVKFILYLLLLVILGSFLSLNSQEVTLNYGVGSVCLPLFLVMVAAMLLGCLVAWSYELVHQQRYRREIKRLQQEIKRLEGEVSTSQN